MVKNLYVVYDKLAGIWLDPQLAPSDINDETDNAFKFSAIREMRNTDSYLYKNADDLDLYHIGSYDDKTGSISLLNVKRLVFHYSSLKGE